MNAPLQKLKNLDLYIAMLCLAILIIITFAGVIMRYCFSQPILWQEEVQMALIIWTVFLGGSAAFRQGNQVAMEILVDALPPRAKAVAEVFIFLVVTVVLAFLGLKGGELVQQFADTARSTNILHVPTQYIYCIIPVGCLLMIVNNACAAWQRVLAARALAEQNAEQA